MRLSKPEICDKEQHYLAQDVISNPNYRWNKGKAFTFNTSSRLSCSTYDDQKKRRRRDC